LSLAEETIFRAHAAIGFDGEWFFVADLGSTNGTLVKGSSVSKQPLKSDGEIQMGKLRIGETPPR
jgi:pSer/pThr/pTyr-binding forkhead associated (FHA) protein